MAPRTKSMIDISIIVTTHAEGILIHRTMASVRRATDQLKNKYRYEIILHADNPTDETEQYIQQHKDDVLKEVRVFKNSFKDLGSSRNFAISRAQGQFVATIDADDIMSENWLRLALDTLTSRHEPTVAHSEVTVEFEGADSLVIKHGEIDMASDTLLSVFSNRWNSVIVAPRSLLLEEPYAANSAGYGYEDWHLNCRLIAKGVHNILIPKTAIFVRRKKMNSEWARQIQAMAVLRGNPLLAFDAVRKINNPFTVTPRSNIALPKSIKTSTKSFIVHRPLIHKLARRIKISLKRREVMRTRHSIPQWLVDEWRSLHTIDRQIFPSEHLINHIPIYDTITADHKTTGNLYKQLIDNLRHDTYDYVLFVPWLIKGGADQYAINYANTIASLNTKKRVLVVATLPASSLWVNKLHKSIDFLDFGTITQHTSPEIKHRLMAHLIENGSIKNIHIINSEFGYDFAYLHKEYVQATDRKLVVTSFSQSVDHEGRIFGYSHTHVPLVYDIATLITSDNQTVLDMWQKEYGFDAAKLAVHHQPIVPLESPITSKQPRKPLRILWAARIAPEKQPELIGKIGELTKDRAIIDVYGTVEAGSKQHINNLPSNVHYKGVFDGFSSLPLDTYDTLLYTSLFDGMPNTILDAANHKLPIISSAVGGIPEFIESGETGLLVQDISNPEAYAAAIHRLSSEPELSHKLRENAYKSIEAHFSIGQYEKSVLDMLKRLGY